MRVVAALLSAFAAGLVAAAHLGALPDRVTSRRRPRSTNRLESALQQAGVDITPLRFWSMGVFSSAAVFVVVLLMTDLVAVASAPSAFAALAPRWWVARRAAARRQAIQQAWPDAIRDVVASVRAGMTVARSLEQLASSGPAPLRSTFRRFTTVARVAGTGAALTTIRDELADPTSDRIVEVLRVADQRGGATVPQILEDLAAAATKDLWLLEEIETESLEQRINARAVFVLPWAVLLAVTIQDGPFREFYASSAGFLVIGIGAIASGAGMLLVSRLGASPDEPRVLVRDR